MKLGSSFHTSCLFLSFSSLEHNSYNICKRFNVISYYLLLYIILSDVNWNHKRDPKTMKVDGTKA